ncbi:MAG: hypothetical protein JJ992_15430, partial [Planctomycetes bacterium]|nr:hypothetical protein [Planctomycetota bacterium]
MNFLLGPLVFCFFVWCFVRGALQPLSGPGAKVKGPSKFFISDILWLLMLLQIPLAGVSLLKRGPSSPVAVIPIFSMIALFIFLWLFTVRMLSGLGVVQPVRRGLC